jgi:hypothetical protein
MFSSRFRAQGLSRPVDHNGTQNGEMERAKGPLHLSVFDSSFFYELPWLVLLINIFEWYLAAECIATQERFNDRFILR